MSTSKQRRVWFERNEQAEALEADGLYDQALALYEANVAEGCDVAFTYERLAAIYRRNQRYDDELQALEKALAIERRRGPTAQTVRLQQRIATTSAVREREQAGSRPAQGHLASEPLLRDRAAAAQQKKGCLFTLALFAAAGALLGGML